jgi:hypothetical protein
MSGSAPSIVRAGPVPSGGEPWAPGSTDSRPRRTHGPDPPPAGRATWARIPVRCDANELPTPLRREPRSRSHFGAGPRHLGCRTVGDRTRTERGFAASGGVPGTGLEPVRPQGAARFKLAVSAFHHPGSGSLGRTSAYVPPHRRATTSLSGGTPPNSGSTNRGCLILLATEGASASGRGNRTHPRPPDLLICRTTPTSGIDAISTPPDGGPSPPQGGPGARGIRPGSRTETGVRTDTGPPTVEDHGRNALKYPTARQEPLP